MGNQSLTRTTMPAVRRSSLFGWTASIFRVEIRDHRLLAAPRTPEVDVNAAEQVLPRELDTIFCQGVHVVLVEVQDHQYLALRLATVGAQVRPRSPTASVTGVPDFRPGEPAQFRAS